MHQKLTVKEFHNFSQGKLQALEAFISSQALESFVIVAQINQLNDSRQRAKEKKQNVLYQLLLQDGPHQLKARASIKVIPNNIGDGTVVRAICQCQPVLNMHDCLVTEANIVKIEPASPEEGLYVDQTSILLKSLTYVHQPFPKKNYPKVCLIYSNSSSAQVHQDFLHGLHYQINYIELIEKKISFSNVAELSQTISEAKADILVIIRGGGDTKALESFDHPDVIRALASSATFRITGIGHSSDRNLINLFADYTAITPTDAGSYLKKMLYQKFIQHKKEKENEELILSLQQQLQTEREQAQDLTKKLDHLQSTLTQIDRRLEQVAQPDNSSLKRLIIQCTLCSTLLILVLLFLQNNYL